MDEFAVDEEFVASEEFQSALAQNDFMLTGPLLDRMFDRAFSKRTFNVHFHFNPNVKQFK